MSSIVLIGTQTGTGSTAIFDMYGKGTTNNASLLMARGAAAATGKFEVSHQGTDSTDALWVSCTKGNTSSLIEGITADSSLVIGGCWRFVRGTVTAGLGAFSFYIISP